MAPARSPLLSGALPPAKRHGSESRHHFYVIYKVAHHRRARRPSHGSDDDDCAGEERRVPRMAACDMPACETHVGGTQYICVSAADDWERSCRRIREHARYTSMDSRTKDDRAHTTDTQAEPVGRDRGATGGGLVQHDDPARS